MLKIVRQTVKKCCVNFQGSRPSPHTVGLPQISPASKHSPSPASPLPYTAAAPEQHSPQYTAAAPERLPQYTTAPEHSPQYTTAPEHSPQNSTPAAHSPQYTAAVGPSASPPHRSPVAAPEYSPNQERVSQAFLPEEPQHVQIHHTEPLAEQQQYAEPAAVQDQFPPSHSEESQDYVPSSAALQVCSI